MSRAANRRKKTIRSGMTASSKTRSGVVRPIEKAKPAETSKPAETGKSRSRENSSRPKNEVLAGASSTKNQERSEQIRNSILIVFSLVLTLVIGIGIGSRDRDSVVDSAINLLTENAPIEISRQALERAAIEGALKASGDQWANYFPSSAIDKLEERNSNILTGIGVTLKKARSGAIEIVKVISGTTAEKAGLLAGDQILEVNETDVQGASLATVGALIRGEIGRELQLRVLRNSEKIEFSVATERVNLNTVEGSQIDNGVAYLAITNFASGTADEAKSAISSLDSRNGVIIDLRNNPGGQIQEAVNVAEIFIGNGLITSYKVSGEERVFNARNRNPILSPIVVMINRGTSSAAELLAAAIQDRNRGVVIGERSYGKGSVQDFVTLQDGSKIELTVALYLTPSGRTIEGVGVTPDLVVKAEDLNLKALQILGGLSELNQPVNE
ncbi:MAG: PDZ domain-containing protein [Actinomycetales bacterium]|nr:PDZ domain-containing protein [Actinomycetales bacterium]